MESTLRNRKKERFTIIDNVAIEDPNLGFDSLGLLCYLLSKPSGWKVNSYQLSKSRNKCGRDRVLRLLNEIEEFGYLLRYKSRNPDGTFIHVTEVSDIPEFKKDNGIHNASSRVEFSDSGKRGVGKGGVGEPDPIVNTNIVNTELINSPLPLSSKAADPCGERDCFSFDSPDLVGLPSVCDALNPGESDSCPPPTINPFFASPIDNLSQEPTTPGLESVSPPRRTTEVKRSSNPSGERYDRRQANRDRAKSASIYEQGLSRKRWKDRVDFEKFKSYLRTWAKNQSQDPEKNKNGESYGDGYIQSVLSRTATAENTDSPDLIVWRYWNQEIPAPPLVQQKAEYCYTATDPAKIAGWKQKIEQRRAEINAEKEERRKIRQEFGFED